MLFMSSLFKESREVYDLTSKLTVKVSVKVDIFIQFVRNVPAWPIKILNLMKELILMQNMYVSE